MRSDKKPKSKFRILVEYILFLILYKVLEVLPMSVAMSLASNLLKLLYYIDRRHSRRTVQHILYAGVETDPVKAAKLARANFGEFGKLLVEIVKINKYYSMSRLRLSGSVEAQKLVSGESDPNIRQFVFVSAHYGNWEVAGSAIADINRKKIISLMRSFENPLIGKKIINQRANERHSLVEKDLGLRPILQAFKEGKSMALVADQHAASGEGVEVEFFGHPARHHKTPALLHLKTGYPIVPILIRRISDNFEFECIHGEPIIHTPTDDRERDIALITQRVSWQIEDIIRKDPVQWLWAPRHWLSIERRGSDRYADWKPRFDRAEVEKQLKEQKEAGDI